MRELLRQATIISIKVILYGLPFAIGSTFIVGAGMTALNYISSFIMTRRENEDFDEKMDT